MSRLSALLRKTYRGSPGNELVSVCDPVTNDVANEAYHRALKATGIWKSVVDRQVDWAELNLRMGLCPFCTTSVAKPLNKERA